METAYSRSYSPCSVSRTGSAGTDVEDIRHWVHGLNELVQKQLEDTNRRYIELYERHEKDKEQRMQQMQSMEQRMMTMYRYFE